MIAPRTQKNIYGLNIKLLTRPLNIPFTICMLDVLVRCGSFCSDQSRWPGISTIFPRRIYAFKIISELLFENKVNSFYFLLRPSKPKLNAVFFPSSTPKLPEKKSFTSVYLAVAGAIFIFKLSDFFHNIPGPKVK